MNRDQRTRQKTRVGRAHPLRLDIARPIDFPRHRHPCLPDLSRSSEPLGFVDLVGSHPGSVCLSSQGPPTALPPATRPVAMPWPLVGLVGSPDNPLYCLGSSGRHPPARDCRDGTPAASFTRLWDPRRTSWGWPDCATLLCVPAQRDGNRQLSGCRRPLDRRQPSCEYQPLPRVSGHLD
jgi:hypothetical protein